jgi:uncharacterized membrane protein YhaH (DUF805 family)
MNYYIHVLKNYAVVEGRARRAEYWWFVLFNLIASISLSVVDGVAGTVYLGVRLLSHIVILTIPGSREMRLWPRFPTMHCKNGIKI